MTQKPKRVPSSPRLLIARAICICILLIGGLLYMALGKPSDAISVSALSTDTPMPSPTPSDSIDSTPMCLWNWATNDAPPEQIDSLNEALAGAGYEDYELVASAYGEDYICMRGEEVVSTSFHMMDISAKISLTVDGDTLANPTMLGSHIRQILSAFEAEDSLAKINRLDISFVHESDSLLWTALYSESIQAIANDISDDDLFAMGVQE